MKSIFAYSGYQAPVSEFSGRSKAFDSATFVLQQTAEVYNVKKDPTNYIALWCEMSAKFDLAGFCLTSTSTKDLLSLASYPVSAKIVTWVKIRKTTLNLNMTVTTRNHFL